MSSGEDHSQEFSEALEEALPADLKDAATESPDTLSDHTLIDNLRTTHVQSTAESVIDTHSDALEADAGLTVGSQTREMGLQIFQQYRSQTDLTGNVLELIAGASLYCACKVTGVPVDPERFTTSGPELLTTKRLLRRTKEISHEVGLDATAFLDPTHYVPQYCQELGLGDEVIEQANEILRVSEEAGITSGKSPSGLAAAAIYCAARLTRERVNQDEVAEVANTSTVTIRNRYQEQAEAYAEANL